MNRLYSLALCTRVKRGVRKTRYEQRVEDVTYRNINVCVVEAIASDNIR